MADSHSIERRYCAFATLALVAALAGLPARGAHGVETRNLAGWWIAIDDTFPKLWEAGVAPMEEILIVNTDGRFEDRVMNFFSGSAQVCAERKICGDLPIVASGRLRVAGDLLTITQRRVSADRLESGRADPAIRRAALSTTAAWTIAADGDLLTLQAVNATRTLAKIAPARLQRLRAGMRVSGLAPAKYWRCFLASATAQLPAFASIRGATTEAPDFLDQYLRIASYLMTLDAMIKRPTIDDPATRNFIGHETEELLVEEFGGVAMPASLTDSQRLKAQVAAIEARVRAKMIEQSGGAPAPQQQGRSPIGDAEVAAFAFVASDDPAAKKLFCRE